MPNKEQEKDPFSALMFPSKRVQKQDSEDEESIEGMSEHEWLFGKRRNHQKEEYVHTSYKNQSTFEKVVNNVNLPELMNHFDTIMTSAQNLKPLYQQIKPVISSILNTKK